MPPRRDRAQWHHLAGRAILALVRERKAVIWAEAEAALAETDWVAQNVEPRFPPRWRLDPHVLTPARRDLEQAGLIAPETKTYADGRVITSWNDGAAEQERRLTAVNREAARKRRLYRGFVSWTSKPELCGRVAERVVDATLRSPQLHGTQLWLPPGIKVGQITAIGGRPVPIGPLDATGHWAKDPYRPQDGFIEFGIEVKNVRQTLYAWHKEVWDLIAKLGEMPQVVPILIARRVHITTFRFFKDIGALAWQSGQQWFSERIEADRFNHVCATFGFADAARREIGPARGLTDFFARTLRHENLMAEQAAKWYRAAPIVGAYSKLRDPDLDFVERQSLWSEFCTEIEDAGLYQRAGWGHGDV